MFQIAFGIGNDTVIEASGTNAGVITTRISSGKWTYWGEMKGVDYTGAAEEIPQGQKYGIHKAGNDRCKKNCLQSVSACTGADSCYCLKGSRLYREGY